MSHETAAPERKHIRSIERRIAHLEGRLEARKALEGVLQGSATYEAAELAALRVAHQVMRLYRDTASEDEESTHSLLQIAADEIDDHVKFLSGLSREKARLLADDLRQRAALLKELEQ